jgi:hypothetical protein
MANKLFQEAQQNNPMNRFSEFMKNPIDALSQSNLNVPPEYQNNPKGAVDYLVQTGRIPQAQYNKVMRMAQMMGIKL